MSKWKECKLGDIIKVKHGFAFKGKFITENQNDNILVTPGNFHIGGGFKSDKFKYYSSDDFPSEYILSGNDIVVTMTDLSKESDTLGYSAKIPISSKNKYLHNQRIGLLQFFNPDFDSDYIYWLLRTRDYQGYVVGSASGTSIMHTSPSRIEDYVCLFPPLLEQKAIAGVLSSLDDKIDLLHRQNKTLEAMAETLFRQWFVEEASEDWAEGKLGDIVEFNYGIALKEEKRSGSGYPVIGSSGIVGFHNEFLVKSPGIVTGRKGTLGIINYIFDNFTPIDTTFYITGKIGSTSLLFEYFLLRTCDFANMDSDSAVPGLNRNLAHSIPVTIPPKELIDMFSVTMRPLFEKIKSNQLQIRTLEKLRNTLLPKLMSGEVRV